MAYQITTTIGVLTLGDTARPERAVLTIHPAPMAACRGESALSVHIDEHDASMLVAALVREFGPAALQGVRLDGPFAPRVI